jgi:hypothetical protein
MTLSRPAWFAPRGSPLGQRLGRRACGTSGPRFARPQSPPRPRRLIIASHVAREEHAHSLIGPTYMRAELIAPSRGETPNRSRRERKRMAAFCRVQRVRLWGLPSAHSSARTVRIEPGFQGGSARAADWEEGLSDGPRETYNLSRPPARALDVSCSDPKQCG